MLVMPDDVLRPPLQTSVDVASLTPNAETLPNGWPRSSLVRRQQASAAALSSRRPSHRGTTQIQQPTTWRTPMDRLEFEADLRREGFSVVNASLKPNTSEANHCHDFDARLYVLGGEITTPRDNTPETFLPSANDRSHADCTGVRCRHHRRPGQRGVGHGATRATLTSCRKWRTC